MSSRSPFSNSIAKRINRNIGKAIHKYDMISNGDKIAVGVSGGCDSLTLLWFLIHRLPRIPIQYDLICIHIDPGFENGFAPLLEIYAQELGVSLCIDYTDFGIIAHGPENRENPCFLCARLRRKRIFEIAEQHGCNKVALGHNKDDLIETLFINMLYAGEISSMMPLQSLFQGKLTVIRPLAYTDSDIIRHFVKSFQLPEFINPCPSSVLSHRSEIRDMLSNLYRKNKKIKGNLFRAMHNVKPEYLLPSSFRKKT
ncbi:potassium-transporting ATPase subunit A [Candidatus Magnetomorum sp. HK-1]|nr:potassium-transporting ATPase subunit A [Candidatus Magnetomorum sp. HK-1]